MSFSERKESNVGYNSWTHHDYSYFPNELACAATALAADIGLFDILEAEGDISDKSNSSSDEGGGAVTATGTATPLRNAGGTLAAASPQPEQRHRDPGWDDTEDSDHAPGSSERE
jgi:hypothetical protein